MTKWLLEKPVAILLYKNILHNWNLLKNYSFNFFANSLFFFIILHPNIYVVEGLNELFYIFLEIYQKLLQ